MIRLVVKSRARGDLADIWRYTADNYGIEQADAYVGSIYAQIERSLAFPHSGSPVAGLPAQYRKARSGAHRAIYRCTQAELIVVRIIHEREDVPDDLGEPS